MLGAMGKTEWDRGDQGNADCGFRQGREGGNLGQFH